MEGNGVIFLVGVTLRFRMFDVGVTLKGMESGILEGEGLAANGCEDRSVWPGMTPALRAKSVSSSSQFRSSSAKVCLARGGVLGGALFPFGVDGCCCKDATKPYIDINVISHHHRVNLRGLHTLKLIVSSSASQSSSKLPALKRFLVALGGVRGTPSLDERPRPVAVFGGVTVPPTRARGGEPSPNSKSSSQFSSSSRNLLAILKRDGPVDKYQVVKHE